jgi:hypothetical protein
MADNLAAEARVLARKIGAHAKTKRGRPAQREYALVRELRSFARTIGTPPVAEEQADV